MFTIYCIFLIIIFKRFLEIKFSGVENLRFVTEQNCC